MEVEDVEALPFERAPDAPGSRAAMSTMFGSVPFAGTITERPTGMTSARRLVVAPEAGVERRVKLPGGSLPMIVASRRRAGRSASACSSACSITAPQNDHEYGTTMPDLHAAEDME